MTLPERLSSSLIFLSSAVGSFIGVGVILANEKLYNLLNNDIPGIDPVAKSIATAFITLVDSISNATSFTEKDVVVLLGTGMVGLSLLTIILTHPNPKK